MELSERSLLETLPSEFDYFESSVIQAAIIAEYEQPYGPVGTLQAGSPIEIAIPPSNNAYRDLNNSRLEVKCKIVNADGTDLAANAPVGPVNLLLHSMFQNIEVEIGGKRISDPNNFYPYRSFFETLLTYSPNVLKTRLYAEGWEKDTSGQFDDFRLVGPADGAAAPNQGHLKRAQRFLTSRTVTLTGRPHLDLFHQDKDLPPGVRLNLRFIPCPTEFVLKRGAGAALYKLKISSIRLWLRAKEVSSSLLLAHQAMLQQHNMRLPYNKVALKHLTIPTGVTAQEFDNIYAGLLPIRMLVAFVRDDHMQPAWGANPFLFENLNISYMALRVNGEQFPRTPLQPDFGENADYIREYLMVIDAMNLDFGNKAIDLSPTEWATNYPFFIFRLTPTGLPTVPATGAARLEIQFRAATTRVNNVICYAEFPAMLEIDQFSNVIA